MGPQQTPLVKKARNVPVTKEHKILNLVPDRLISKKVGCTEMEPDEKLWKLNYIAYSDRPVPTLQLYEIELFANQQKFQPPICFL